MDYTMPGQAEAARKQAVALVTLQKILREQLYGLHSAWTGRGSMQARCSPYNPPYFFWKQQLCGLFDAWTGRGSMQASCSPYNPSKKILRQQLHGLHNAWTGRGSMQARCSPYNPSMFFETAAVWTIQCLDRQRQHASKL